MHYYQFNIGDYKSHTDYLTPIEDLAYRRMLDWCYLHEKPLPLDVDDIARKINLRDEIGAIELVLLDFFEKSENGYTQNRIFEEIEIYHTKAENARKNGKKGGRPRKETQEKPKKNPVGFENKPNPNPEESESKAKHKPLTNNQEPDKKEYVRPDGLTDAKIKERMETGFNHFWESWKDCKKALGVKNNSTPKETRKKWDSYFNAAWWKKHTESDYSDEVNKITNYAIECHQDSGDFNPHVNMMTSKFFTRQGWKQ